MLIYFFLPKVPCEVWSSFSCLWSHAFSIWRKKKGRCSWKKKRAKGMCPLNWLISTIFFFTFCVEIRQAKTERISFLSMKNDRAVLLHFFIEFQVFVKCIVYKEREAVEAVVRIQAKKVKRRSVLLNKKQEHETCSQCWCIFFLVGPYFFMSANESAKRSGISRGKNMKLLNCISFRGTKKKRRWERRE